LCLHPEDIGFLHMDNQPAASSLRSGERAPLKDLTDNSNRQSRQGKKQQDVKGWYARLYDEEKAEYLKRQRAARQQKKDADHLDGVDGEKM
jgi:hypothetical protein